MSFFYILYSFPVFLVTNKKAEDIYLEHDLDVSFLQIIAERWYTYGLSLNIFYCVDECDRKYFFTESNFVFRFGIIVGCYTFVQKCGLITGNT